MNSKNTLMNRRNFLTKTGLASVGLFRLNNFTQSTETILPAKEENLYVIGPKEGNSLQVGALASMFNYNRNTITNSVQLKSRLPGAKSSNNQSLLK